MNDCMIWAGSTDRNGYPQRKWMHVNYMIHRLMYENFVAPIRPGMTLDHTCKVTTCINPDHLEQVTLSENVRRGVSPSSIHREQTHCVNGHEFTEENTQWYKSRGRQARKCRTCSRKYINAWYAAKRAAGLEEKTNE